MRNIFLIGIVVFLLYGCGNNGEKNEHMAQKSDSIVVIRIKGSETARKIITAIDEFYKKTNSTTQVDYTGGGSNFGIMSMMHDEADVIFVSRDLNTEEVNYFKDKKYVIDTIAIDGLAIVVNFKNPIKTINMNQLSGIYGGRISNWKEIGGLDKPIKVYAREATSGTYSMFKEKVLKNSDSLAKQYISLNLNEDIVSGIKNDELGIGYVGLGYILASELKVLSLSDSLNKNPLAPEYATVKTGSYPLKRYIVAIYNPVNEKIKNYINCLHNKNINKLINESGFIPFRMQQ